MSRNVAVDEGCSAEVLVVRIYQARSCRHSCGLGMLRPVRQRMLVPVWVEERSEGWMLSLYPYHTCWSTHQILQPIIFFFCLLVCLHPPSLIPSMHRFTNFTNIAKDLKRKQKNYCIFKNILKTTCLNILFECSLFPVFFPFNTDEIIYSEQGGEWSVIKYCILCIRDQWPVVIGSKKSRLFRNHGIIRKSNKKFLLDIFILSVTYLTFKNILISMEAYISTQLCEKK